MKRIIFVLFAAALTLSFVCCDEEVKTYTGPEYIMFTDTSTTCPVQEEGDYISIPVASTVAYDYDRTISVEIVDNGSSAIEGVHYRLKSNIVTIKAGELTGSIMIKGNYENIEATDTLSFIIQLITPGSVKWNLYADHEKTKVHLKKVCPLSIDNFTGYCIVTSTFAYNFLGYLQKLIHTEKHPTLPNTVVLKDFIRPGFNLNITFNNDDVLTPKVTIPDGQIVSNEVSTIFGGLPGIGDDKLRVGAALSEKSSYQSCDNTAKIYLEYYINRMNGKKFVTAGDYYHSLQWISDAEAEIFIKEGGLN